jgi:ABC-type polysaccharide transport system permease subunit
MNLPRHVALPGHQTGVSLIVVITVLQVGQVLSAADYVFYNANKTSNEALRTIMAVLKGDEACTKG